MGEKTESFPVLSAVRLDGRTFEPGETIALTPALFEQLKGTGAIGLEPVGGDDKKGAPTEAERAALIRDAIGKLAPADLTQAGKPKVAAVEKLVGFDVSAAEIEAAIAAAPTT